MPSGVAPFERRLHRENGELHVRELIDAEAQEPEHAEDDERQRHHPGEDGAVDRDVGERHGCAASAVLVRAAATPGVTAIGAPEGSRSDTGEPSTS